MLAASTCAYAAVTSLYTACCSLAYFRTASLTSAKMRRYKKLRVYDVVTSAAVSLVEVFRTSPADPPPPALTGGEAVVNLGFSLQAIQQVSQLKHFPCLYRACAILVLMGTECCFDASARRSRRPRSAHSLQHSQGAFW